MNVKNLAIAVGILAILSALVAFLDRPAAPLDTDPRIGQPLLAASIASNAESLTLTQNGQSVTVDRQPDGTWQVASYHALPADFDKLRRFIGSLTSASINRVVTRLPERIKRLGFDDSSLRIKTADGTTWSVDLGKNSDRGGRYARFSDDADSPAYLIDLSTPLDTTAKNWATANLITVEPADIAAISLTFSDASNVSAQRENADATWTNATAPDTRSINATRVSSLLTSLTNLRFTATSATDHPDVVDARDHARTATLTTFTGETLTIKLGRRPEEVVPAEPVPDATTDETETEPTQPETIPAGPVFVSISGPTTLAPLSAHDQLAFQISEYTFTGLPQSPDELLVTPPAPAQP